MLIITGSAYKHNNKTEVDNRRFDLYNSCGGMAPSSSGPGYLVLIQKIAGSNPAGVTNISASSQDGVFILAMTCRASNSLNWMQILS